ncbi:MAG: beta-propeller domain-containing protein [Candidatus Aenigmatarchaeota archaeon]
MRKSKSGNMIPLFIFGVAILFMVLQFTVPKPEVKNFSSYDELANFLKERSGSQYYGPRGFGFLEEDVTAPVAASTTATAVEKSSEYSTTNIQVAGVDEPDIVKTDGKYIYASSWDRLTIVDAYPADWMKTVSTIQFNGSVSNMFVNKDRLVVFGNAYGYMPYLGRTAGAPITDMPYYYPSPNAFVYVYDISDRANPVLVRNLTLEGSYQDARMIGDYVYAIAQQPVQVLDSGPVLPVMYTGTEAKEISADSIAYFDEYDTSFAYTFVIALNTQNDAEEPNEKVFLLGYSQNLYVSENNIYTVYTKYMKQAERNSRLIEALMPSLPLDLQSTIRGIQRNPNITAYEKMYEVGKAIQSYAADLGPEEGAKFMKSMEERMLTILMGIEKETEKTVIHKISVSGPNVEYKTSGEVPGRVLNQFSMDEYDGNFRIATTTGQSWSGTSLNHVYVLDQSLNTIGKLENLAPGEQIYSARFMGERAYLVTFVRTDPLFVIDLSNPYAPAALGELKIPGFSEYLHPYDANHLIGVGRMTDENGRRTGQIKLALFDVTDVANPKEMSSYLIGKNGGYAYSEALNDHKAFLFSKEKNLLVIPASVNNYRIGEYGSYEQGAYVFDATLENGLVLKGTVTHKTANASAKEYYYEGDTAVRRSLYMDNTLYTVSDAKIVANRLADLGKISEVAIGEAAYQPPILRVT